MSSFLPTTRDDLTPQVMWRLIRCWDRELLSLSNTPLKINMEPNNRPIEKENHLRNLHFFCSSSSSCELARSSPTTAATSSRRRRQGGAPAGGGGCWGALTRAGWGAWLRPGRATWAVEAKVRVHLPCPARMKGCAAGLPFPGFLAASSHCLGHMAFWASQDWWSAAMQIRAQINIHHGYIQVSCTSASHGRAPTRQGR